MDWDGKPRTTFKRGDNPTVQVIGKGGIAIRKPMTVEMAKILFRQLGKHPEYVFTFVAQRTRNSLIRGKRQTYVAGKRYPITQAGWSSHWARIRLEAAKEAPHFWTLRAAEVSAHMTCVTPSGLSWPVRSEATLSSSRSVWDTPTSPRA